MCLAPLCRVQCDEAALEELDGYLDRPASQRPDVLGDWIRKKPRRSGRTEPRGRAPLRLALLHTHTHVYPEAMLLT